MSILRSLLIAVSCMLGAPAWLRAQAPFTCAGRSGLPAEWVARALQRAEARDGVRHVKCHVVIAAGMQDGQLLQASTAQRVQRDIDHANLALDQSGTGIQLQVCDSFQVVVSQGLFNPAGNAAPFLANRRPGYISIFYVHMMQGGFAGGYANDMAMVAFNAGREVLVHEVGHILGLDHTYLGIGELELVDGSNCATAADRLCDTPADPGLNQPGMMALDTCAYIGTVTDANGDPYQPLLNNVMSASRCLRDGFTPMQGAVMRYVLDSLQAHLLATTTPVLIDPIPATLCANAPPFTLSASPGPGTFSGPLVQGDQLINFPNPAGDYHVTYVPDEGPDGGLFSMVDEHHVSSAWHDSFQTAYNTDSVRQSFRAGRDGFFEQLDARLYSAQQQPIRMRFYAGTGTALTLLHDTTSLFTNADTSWMRFAFPEGIACAAGATYSYVLTAAEPFVAVVPVGGILLWGSNSLGNLNLMFRSWVRAPMPCQQATRHYGLYAAPEQSLINLASAYCSDAQEVNALIPDLAGTTASLVLINGEATNAFVPAALGIGAHLAGHIYTINGCTDTLAQAFAVVPPASFDYAGIPSALCILDPPMALASEPPSGHFLVNGEETAVLDPMALGLGAHTITHVFSTDLDTVSFADQACCATGYALNTFLYDHEVNWQAFVPVQAGVLESIRIPLELFTMPRQLVVELLQGTGLDGPVLRTDTITASAHGGVLLTGTGIVMDPGSSYTWSIRKVPDGIPNVPPMIGFVPGDHYPDGASAVAYWTDTIGDLRFQQFITQVIACGDSVGLDVLVEVCSGIAGADHDEVRVQPNPASDRLDIVAGGASRFALVGADGRAHAGGRLPMGGRHTVDVSGLAEGVYLLQLWRADGSALPPMRVARVR